MTIDDLKRARSDAAVLVLKARRWERELQERGDFRDAGLVKAVAVDAERLHTSLDNVAVWYGADGAR